MAFQTTVPVRNWLHIFVPEQGKGDSEMAENPKIRTPIVCVMGHVDHGKTSLLDRIRGSSVVSSEVGAITQHIGATIVPIDAIRSMSGIMGKSLNIPGLLFIDTPGHHAFTTLRARGGALADIAILVVDISQGFQPQTIESVNILKQHKTPFIVAANKIDRIHGWRSHDNMLFTETFKLQSERTQRLLDERIYAIVEDLYNAGFSSDRYDRIRDFTKNISVVPTSARTGEGIPDLLMVSLGLAQRFLEKDLRLHANGPALGTVIEIKEEKGFGITLDAIIYDGVLNTGDQIVVGAFEQPIVTKVRALLKPESAGGFKRVKRVIAAAGVKIAAPGIENALAGSPVRVVANDTDKVVADVEKEIRAIAISTQDVGVVIKADTIGAL